MVGANWSRILWQQNILHKLFPSTELDTTCTGIYTKVNIISNKTTDRGRINYNKFLVTKYLSRSSPCSNKAWSCSVFRSSVTQFPVYWSDFLFKISSSWSRSIKSVCFTSFVTCATFPGRQTNYKTIERLEKYKQGSVTLPHRVLTNRSAMNHVISGRVG